MWYNTFMAVSNNRFQEPDSVHHLVSRIAHRVFFMKDDECNDFVVMMRRVAAFCGIRLIGWCIMTNHFHILVHLPVRPDVIDEDEILRRVKILKGSAGAEQLIGELARHRAQGAEEEVARTLDRLRARMYDLGEFMKTLKQWFSQEYNRRFSHVGTLWESAYHDKGVPMKVSDMAKVLAYIHLNPIRAAIVTGFTEYTWSSLTAALKGDVEAIDGLRFAYGAEEASPEELIDTHCDLMETLLEEIKRKRAEEIARKRAAGYEVQTDALTSEAYVAQAAAHLEKVLEADVEIKEEARRYARSAAKREALEARLRELKSSNPDISIDELVATLGVSRASVYRLLKASQFQV